MRFPLSVLFSVSILSIASSHEKPATIPVVTTWEELQKLPPIVLEDGVKVRLGLEANKFPQWSGGLLYCLTEGHRAFSESDSTSLGPVNVTFTYENDKAGQAEKQKHAPEGTDRKGNYLYVRPLPVDRVGYYDVTVMDRKSNVIAKAQIAGTKDFFHPWMPWLHDSGRRESPFEGIALPNVDSIGPLVVIEAGKGPKGRLPTLLAVDEKPKLTIKMAGKTMVIGAESEFTTFRPDLHFLARWWVNGKPFMPKQIDKLWRFEVTGRVTEEKELSLEVEFHPERLGAKPGDKIGLQLMYVGDEWAWCAGASLVPCASLWRKNAENVRVSNRIEFDVPKERGQ